MKERLTAGFLTLCMALALLPGRALAYPGDTEEAPIPLESQDWEGLAPEEDPVLEEDLSALPFDWDDPIPAFVPGVPDEREEISYPDYALLGELLGEELPPSFDTRDTTQTPTKNQGSNGLCCAFATLAAMEAQLMQQGWGEQDLSELHMAYSLSENSGNEQQGMDRAPSEGIGRQMASSYLMRGTDLSGAVDEASDPYVTTLLRDRDLDISRVRERVWQAQNILFLTGYGKDEGTFDTIKRAIMTYGGVGAYIEMRGQTTATDGTVLGDFLNEETSAYCYNWYRDTGSDRPDKVTDYNHAVEIIGWDDDYPRENFSAFVRPENDGAWLIKNSWGKNWGDNGCAWVSYEDTSFPQVVYCFDGVESYDPGEIVYETDYVTNTEGLSYSSLSQFHYAKVFQKETDGEELLSAVRIFVGAPYTSVEVGVLPQFSDEAMTDYRFTPVGGTEENQDAPYFFPGWYTIELEEPVYLSGEKGDEFALVVKVMAPGTDEGGRGISVGNDRQNKIPASREYYSSNGSYWYHASDTYAYNYCIKAVAEPVGAEARGRVIVDKAASSLLWPLIRGENESRSDVRSGLTLPDYFKGADITWISSGRDVVAEDGTVTRPIADSDRDVSLTAELSANGVTESVEFDLTVPCIPPEDWYAVSGAADAITWENIRGENVSQDSVTENLVLMPSGVLDSGVYVTWTSSDTALIGTNGTVTIPRFDENNTATLTAAVTRGGAERTVEFRLTVPHREATESDRISAAADWIEEDRANRFWPLIRGENQDWDHIRYDLVIPKTVTVEIPGTEPYMLDLRQTVSVGSGVSGGGAWTWIGSNGEVTRPAYGEQDTKGAVYFYAQAGGKAIYGWWATVLSYKGAINEARIENVTTPSDHGTILRASFSAAGNPGQLRYQWYWADDAGGTNPQAIPGAVSERLETTSLGLPPSGRWGTAYLLCEISAPDAAPVRTEAAQVTLTPAAYVSDSDSTRVRVYHVPLDGNPSVYAACYDGNGRMTGIAESVEIDNGEIRFNTAVAGGWRLFFLDGGGRPLRETLSVILRSGNTFRPAV